MGLRGGTVPGGGQWSSFSSIPSAHFRSFAAIVAVGSDWAVRSRSSTAFLLPNRHRRHTALGWLRRMSKGADVARETLSKPILSDPAHRQTSGGVEGIEVALAVDTGTS